MALNAWKTTPERAAIRLVRSILTDTSSPLTTKEIYEEAVRRETGQEYPHPPTVIAGVSAQQPVKKRGVVRKPPPTPPHPENAVRSMRYLKTVVLPHMRDKVQEVEKFHTNRTLSGEEIQHRLATMSKSARKAKGDSLPTTSSVWLWKLRARPPPPPEPKKEKLVFGAEVGVGEDWSHLNKRRRRAREEKVARDVTWLKDLANVNREREALEMAAEKGSIA